VQVPIRLTALPFVMVLGACMLGVAGLDHALGGRLFDPVPEGAVSSAARVRAQPDPAPVSVTEAGAAPLAADRLVRRGRGHLAPPH